MDEIGLNEFLELIIQDKGGTYNQYNQLMDYIAYHETGAKQRMKPNAVQISEEEIDGVKTGKMIDGPGRGLFMFEVGKKEGGNTAVNRTVNYLKEKNVELPTWLRELSLGSKESKSVDVKDLSADQQKMLFLGFHRMHPNANFSKIWSGEQSIPEFWSKYHWSGKEDIEGKLDLFNKSMIAKDSTDALKAKEEELMLKQNMAPFLADSNNVEKLPKEKSILESIFGTKESSLIKDYDHGGVHLPTAESDATYVQQQQFNIPVAQEEQYVDQFGSTSGSLYPSGPEPTLWEKIKNAGANPLATFGYSVRNEEIPWGNVPRHSNPFDTFALGMVNPFAWGESLDASVEAGRQGDYLGSGLELLGAIPTVPAGIGAGKKLAASRVAKGGAPKTKVSVDDLQLVDKSPVPYSSGKLTEVGSGNIQEIISKRKAYLLSDEYMSKRAANTGESTQKIKAHVDAYLKELDNADLSMYTKGELGEGVRGTYSKNKIELVGDRAYEDVLETLDHEIGHLLSPTQKRFDNPYTNVIWKDKKTGKKLTDAEAETWTKELDIETNPKWQAWEDEYLKQYKNYPTIKMEVEGSEELTKYLMDPAEQQVRMVRYGEILKKHGWDGTKKGLTNEIIDKSAGGRSALDNKVWLGSSNLPSDVRQLLGQMKGIKVGTPEWYAQIKKTLPYAWGMTPAAITQSIEKK